MCENNSALLPPSLASTSLPQFHVAFFYFLPLLSAVFFFSLPITLLLLGPLLLCRLLYFCASIYLCPPPLLSSSCLPTSYASSDRQPTSEPRGRIYRNQRWQDMADLFNATIHRGHCVAMPKSI